MTHGMLPFDAAVNFPAVLNRKLVARGGVTQRRWKRQPAAAHGGTHALSKAVTRFSRGARFTFLSKKLARNLQLLEKLHAAGATSAG